MEMIALRFKLLSAPSRLRLLLALQDGEKTVGDLIAITQMTQANVSRHLLLLADGGLVTRRKAHQSVWYRLADGSFSALHNLVYASLQRHDAHVHDVLFRDE